MLAPGLLKLNSTLELAPACSLILILPFMFSSYQGMDNLPATMTLGRKGLYASLGAHRGRAIGDNEAPLLGPNMGQYATLSKQCKTLESSDFY